MTETSPATTAQAANGGQLPEQILRQDRVHAPGEDRRWRESYYFSFFDPRHGIGGFSSLGKRAATGHSGSINVLWGPDRPSLVASEFDTFGQLDDDHLVAGMSYRSDQPFGDWRLGFSGQLNHGGSQIECDEAALGPVSKSRADSVDVSYDLTFTPTHPPYIYAERSEWSELFTGHIDEVGLVRGTVTVDGEVMEIEGRGGKDHSWGVRNWFAPLEWRWIDLVSADGPEIAMWRASFSPDVWVGDGAVFTGEPTLGPERAITGYTESVTTTHRTREPGKPLPTGLHAELHTEAGSHELHGQVVRVLPVVFTRRPDGRLERAWNDRALLSTTVDGAPGWANVEFALPVTEPTTP